MQPETSSAAGAESLVPRTSADIRLLLQALPAPDDAAVRAVAAREGVLTKPAGSLGQLEELTSWLAAWQGRVPPGVQRIAVRIFAGNHGVAARGVSAYPAEVTRQMVANFEAGGAAVCQLCRIVDADLRVCALDLDRPTEDFTLAPAMSEDEFTAAFAAGFAEVESGIDVLCLGEMGIGNTTSAAAIACALHGGLPVAWTGPGTGVEGDRLAAKQAVVAAAVHRHRDAALDPLDLLRRLGGRELVAIAGAVLAARLRRVPVLLDGYVCTAAAAPLAALAPGALDHCRTAHVSAEPGHRLLLRHLGLRPLLSLDMRLGEASGAVLAVALLRAAVACHTGMATFASAGVSGRDSG